MSDDGRRLKLCQHIIEPHGLRPVGFFGARIGMVEVCQVLEIEGLPRHQRRAKQTDQTSMESIRQNQSAPYAPRRVWRSFGAIFAGFLLAALGHLGMDSIMHATGIFPPWGQPMSDALFLWATIYRTIIAVGGSYLTARLAPARPMKHALVGGVIGLILSIAGAAATWNKGPEFGPHWYPLALIVLALPTAWAGGRLYERRVTI